MNTQLYNSLIDARNFLVTVIKNEKEIQSLQHHLKFPEMYADSLLKVRPPEKPKPKEIKLWLFIIFIPAAIIHSIWVSIYNRRIEKNYQKEIEDIKKSPAYAAFRKEVEKDRIRYARELETKTTEHKKYCKDNLWKVGFLPEHYRNFESLEEIQKTIDYVGTLAHYVKCGARTLDEAQDKYAQLLREELEDERYERIREAEERRHKEEMNEMKKIAENQEKVIKNQENIYDEIRKYRNGF